MKKELKELIINGINSWADTDIYALSLFVYDDCDNPCKPTVRLGYNTERKVQEEISNASNADEARWNYAFWLQNSTFVFGEDDTADIVKKWILTSGFPYYEEVDLWDDEDLNENGVPDDVEVITEEFVELLVEVVQEIHDEGILTKKFGKELPIIIHELEYYDQIAFQNSVANGKELVKDFTDWIMSMYEISY
ncbi:MAG: DUF4303 domain-containing protein [Lachnospiraceae bacterium]|nr:DUF4303 domain-containing protein [Lachnospiraceae bacterium]